jgi:hypothetical protein
MTNMPAFLVEMRTRIQKEKHKQRLNSYYRHMDLLKAAISSGDANTARMHAHHSWAYLDDLIIWDTLLWLTTSEEIRNAVFEMDFINQEYDDLAIELIRKKYPQLDANSSITGKTQLRIQSIPCLEDFGMMCATMGLSEEIEMINQIVDYYSDLVPWKEKVENLKKTFALSEEIVTLIKRQQGILQADLKKHIQKADGRTISNICYYLDKYKRISRNRSGKTYSLNVT